jgi:hypothetical protein
MEMHQIRYFLAVCDEKNFSRAAIYCGVRQPSLSQAIKKLEAEFGGPLFERGGRATRLSNLGKTVRPYLAEIDRSAAHAKREAARVLAVHSVPTLTSKERFMHKAVYGAAIAAVALLSLAVVTVRLQPPASASSPMQASNTVDVRALEAKIDIKALPRVDILSEAEE